MKITTIGLDLAKSVFQAHGVDETGRTVLVKKLHRKQMLPFFSKLPACLIGIEAYVLASFHLRCSVRPRRFLSEFRFPLPRRPTPLIRRRRP